MAISDTIEYKRVSSDDNKQKERDFTKNIGIAFQHYIWE